MENLPLSGYRNYQSLINLVPGATPARFQNAVTDTPGRALSTNVNGQERGANNTRVDGSADILVTMPHHAVYVPPVESIQEVNISTNNFDAEQGMTGGAAVTVITKSGTNNFRGTASRCTTAARCVRSPGTRIAPGRQRSRKHAKHQRRQSRRPDQEEQTVLLRELGRHLRANGLLEQLLCSDCRLPQRKFQPHARGADSERGRYAHHDSHNRGGQHSPQGRDDLRSLLRQSRTGQAARCFPAADRSTSSLRLA